MRGDNVLVYRMALNGQAQIVLFVPVPASKLHVAQNIVPPFLVGEKKLCTPLLETAAQFVSKLEVTHDILLLSMG